MTGTHADTVAMSNGFHKSGATYPASGGYRGFESDRSFDGFYFLC